MAAVFPGAVRLYTAKTDLVDTVLADHVNLLQDEVTAVETTLGVGLLASSWSGTWTTPGTHASVAARLTNIESGLSTLNTNKAEVSATLTAAGVATLTNKTMSGASNTFSNIPQAAITSLGTDLGLKADLASPALTGTPTAPTQTAGNNSTRIATTAYADGAVSTHAGVTATHGATGAVVGTTNSQTLTNKTLTSPVISSIVNTGTLTLPTSTDTLVGRATTDTLTNKTLTAPIISSIVNTGTLTLPTSTDTLVGRATTDTLTNKTLTSPSLTSPTITGTPSLTGTMTASGGGQFAGLGSIQVVTSGTRPGTPAEGQHIYETDTDKTLAYNGAAWNQISGGSTGGGGLPDVFLLGGM